MIGEGGECNIFLDKFCLKQPLVSKIPLGIFFDSWNSEMTSKIALKSTGIKL